MRTNSEGSDGAGRSEVREGLGGLLSWRAWLTVWLPLAAITILHYGTPGEQEWVHHVARRLYYLPIIVAAMLCGLGGGLAVAAAVCVAYLPHAFLLPDMADPAASIEKVLEIVIYFLVATVAGYLADKARRRREQLGSALEAQTRLTKQLARAERLSSLGEVVAGMAHEVKNPLHSLKGTAEIVDPLIPEEREERRMWEIHRQELDRLARTAERFLSFARPSTGEREKISLRSVAERLVEIVSAEARQRGVELRFEPAGEDLWVRADRDQLAQVGLNIALNAFTAMGERGGALRVSAARRHDEAGEWGCLRIENSGPRIDEDELERIFDPFHGGDHGGSGLGLSISARIVEWHEGFIEVENGGLGVVFHVCLPLEKA
jgi:signal transduction histidine kinase